MIKFSIKQGSSLADVLLHPVWDTTYGIGIKMSELYFKMLRSQNIPNMGRKYLFFIVLKVLYLQFWRNNR